MYPILFEVPGSGWPIYSYGVMLGISIIAGWYLALGLGERDGLPRRAMGNCYFWAIATSLIGARLLYIIANPDNFNELGDFFRFREGGLVAYGGFLGGLAGSAIYCRIKRIRLWAWADAAAAPIALGLALTRLGCFCYGCCYGRQIEASDPGWLAGLAMRFPNWSERFPDYAEQHHINGSPAFLHHVSDLGLEVTAAASYPIVPTQVMASLNGFIAVALILLVRRYRTFRGQMFLTFGAYYGLTRFLFEVVRDDTQRGTIGPPVFGWLGGFEDRLTTSQVIALVTVTASLLGMLSLWIKARRDPEAAMALGEGAAAESDDSDSKASAPSRHRGAKRRRKKKS